MSATANPKVPGGGEAPADSAAVDPPSDATHHIGPVDACPECGGRDFLVEDANDAVLFRCLGCATCWRYELGFVWQVETDDPGSPAAESFQI